MNSGLDQKVIQQLINMFRQFDRIDQVILYGSRAKGTFSKGSDIDLTLLGSNLDQKLLFKIEEKVDELYLPYHVDLSIYHAIGNDELKKHIDRVGKLLYTKENIK
jgi:predicted nucleotidyltransferase